MLPILLEWSRPLDGVELVDGIYQPRSARREAVTLQIESLEKTVMMEFINSPLADGSGFFSRFGFLFDEPIPQWSYVNSSDEFRTLALWLNEPSDRVRFDKLNGFLARTALTPVLQYNDGQPRLVVSTVSLHHLMRMEIAFAASVGARAGVCDFCGRTFLTGPRTNRRATARYCADKHRAAAQRQRATQTQEAN